MPNKWSFIALGAGAYAAFVAAAFPAASAYRWFAPPELRLASIDGTVWSGHAALGSIPGMPLRDIRWNLSAWPLLIGRASGTFEARLADGFVRGTATASMSGVVLRDLQTSTRLQTLAGLLPINDTAGLVSVDVTELELVDGWPVRLVGMLRLSDIAVAPLMPTQSGGLIALGGYEVEFIDGGDAIEGRLADTGGPLEVVGRLALARDRSYVLEGLVRARPEASMDLVRGLEFMTGEPDDSGRRPFNLSGSL